MKNNYKLLKIIGKGTYSTVYLTQSEKNTDASDKENTEEEDVLSKISEIL